MINNAKVIYLDNNATSGVAPEVVDAMLPYFRELYGNPSSIHTFGAQVHSKIEDARSKVAELIGTEPEEIIFTSCGTESDNTALMSALEGSPDKKHIITSAVEHPAVMNFCRHLEKKGYGVSFIPVDRSGQLSLEDIKKSLTKDTAIVSIMHANNETGTLFPVKEIGEMLKGKGIIFHTDAVQTTGKIPIDLKKLNIDMLSVSGHKLHAPKGIGALYVRKGTRFYPYIIGGHQEQGRRSGTENVASIIGFGKACELAIKNLQDEIIHLNRLRNKLENGLLKTCPESSVNGDINNRLPNTTNISFNYIEGEAILLKLNAHGICASSGSACTAGSPDPSHVLKAMKVPPQSIRGSIRFSLSRYNTEEDIDKVLEVMPEIIKGLTALSPLSKENFKNCEN